MLNDKDNKNKLNKYPTIEEQREHFKEFSNLPLAICIVIVVLGTLMGIVSAISTKNVGPFFVCFIISTVVGLITFAILQILLSSQILMVLYLEKISNEIENIKNKTYNDPSTIETLPHTFTQNVDSNIESVMNSENFEVNNNENTLEKEEVYFVVEKEPDIRKEVLEKIVELSAMCTKEEFFEQLQKWMEKYKNKLMFWNVDIYNQINNFFNETSCTVNYDNEGNSVCTYNINDEEYNKLVDLLKDFYGKLV